MKSAFLVDKGMMTTDAVSTCRLILKQITPEDLVEDGLAAINACFAAFTGQPAADHIRQGQELAVNRFASLGGRTETEPATARRFSGDPSLDRGRYFAICKDPNGNDGGTLVRELLAYHNPQKSGLITIIDPNLPEHRHLVPVALRDRALRDLLLLFPPIGGRPHPFARRFINSAKPLYVTLPMRIFEAEIDRVVDLRRPETATWFTKSLSRLNWFDLLPDQKAGEWSKDSALRIHIAGFDSTGFDPSNVPSPAGFAAFPFKPPLESFGDVLPALLCQSIGGGRGAAQIAGLWLRKLGVNGLIYPSARSDSYVLVQDGRVVDWSGFNFVDYRNAQHPKHLAAIDISVGWPGQVQTWLDDWTENEKPIVYETVTINYENHGNRKGSWEVKGIEARRAAPYCFVELAWLLEQLFGPNHRDASAVIGLASNLLQRTWTPEFSHDFVNALMGVRASRERLLRFIASPAFDAHQDVRHSVASILQGQAS